MTSIRFDKESSCWFKDVEINEVFLKVQKKAIIDKFLYRGYIYLNEICDVLGMNWDPHNENVVWIKGDHGFNITYEHTGDNAFTINIGV